MKKAMEDWIDTHCEEIEAHLNKKQQQEGISADERSNLRETGWLLNFVGQGWEISDLRTRDS